MPVVIIARCDSNGATPLAVVWDGKEYRIDKVLDKRKGANHKLGRMGISYTVLIKGQRRVLFLDDKYHWYVEPVQKLPIPGAVHCCRDFKR